MDYRRFLKKKSDKLHEIFGVDEQRAYEIKERIIELSFENLYKDLEELLGEVRNDSEFVLALISFGAIYFFGKELKDLVGEFEFKKIVNKKIKKGGARWR